MTYKYEEMRDQVFTDEGQRMLLNIRDNAFQLMEKAGCANVDRITSTVTGDSWLMLACVDRLVELGELKLVERTKPVAGQFDIYVPSSRVQR